MPDLLVFIPAWNEESQPAGGAGGARGANWLEADVVVIDDGSEDATAEVARRGGAEVVRFPENRGLPAAIAAGYAYAHSHPATPSAAGSTPTASTRRRSFAGWSRRCGRGAATSPSARATWRATSTSWAGTASEGSRRLGTALVRRAMGTLLRRPFHDPMSGMSGGGGGRV